MTDYLRGHKIELQNGKWVYSDTKEPTSETWQKRPCGHCGSRGECLEHSRIRCGECEYVAELEEENKRNRHAFKRIRLACNFADEDKDDIIPTIYEEVNKALKENRNESK